MKISGIEIKRNNLLRFSHVIQLKAIELLPNLNVYLRIFSLKFAGVALALIINIFLARYLGVAQFGVYSQALSLSLIGSTFVLAGSINRNLKPVWSMEIDKSQGVRVFYDSICLVLLITAVSAAILPWLFL